MLTSNVGRASALSLMITLAVSLECDGTWFTAIERSHHLKGCDEREKEKKTMAGFQKDNRDSIFIASLSR